MARARTGVFELRADGWYVRLSFTDESGKRARPWVALGTHNELIAREKAAPMIARQVDPNAEGETFEQAGNRIFKARAAAHPSARNGVSYLRHHVYPVIGAMRPSQVEKRDILSLLRAAAAKGLAGQTLVHVRNSVDVVFRELRKEGALENVPRVPTDEIPEGAHDDRVKCVMTDSELLAYLGWTSKGDTALSRTAQRERQVMAVLARCVGGLRSGELMDLNWERAHVEGARFDALEVVRLKTKRKASKRGSKAVSRQVYALDATPVLSAVARFWWLREGKPAASRPLFPVRRAKSMDQDRTGEKRGKMSWARALRTDVQRAFRDLHAANQAASPAPGSQRFRDLFEGSADRRPLCFHSARNAAVVAAMRVARLTEASHFSAHAGHDIVAHYARMAGEVDVVPVLPQLIVDERALEAVVRSWCAQDGVDPDAVFGPAPTSDEARYESPTEAIAVAERPADGPCQDESSRNVTNQESDHDASCGVIPTISSTWGSLGARGRMFESCRPDQ